MKINQILAIGFMTLAFACGKSKKEVEKEQAKIELEQKRLAEQQELERIHLEKIEVGKSKLRIDLTNELERLKELLDQENKKMEEIGRFQLGRSSTTKEKQLNDQSTKIRKLNDYISNLENEISLINLRETFDFQNTPEGVINYLFESAKNHDFSKLRYLCDPYGENDGDVRGICLVEMQPKEMQNKFAESFKNGRIMGEAKIENETAKIEIAFGPGSDKLETVGLVKRLDNWYLSGL
ncbi:hypothetical protein PY092_10330 [Muricauda sp. 334s03]|uniref:DUF4878 domain-containing protein n=1 Tax=Flagellimonas yonaguniensis TaxID=3031325 RepID=A0ABT5XZH5_9FLAO|nr:hypothetical protein [[Muricauda] yonaguniensis]MDF0716545.1 hypothetical protein [[Muricauda] yonaguniensis]